MLRRDVPSMTLGKAAKSKKEKEAWFQKFLKGLPEEEKTMRSTDRRLTIPKTQKTAKKTVTEE